MRVPEEVGGEVVPVELLPRAPECKRADECNVSCSLERIRQDCFICKCPSTDSNPGHKDAPETVILTNKPQDKIPYDPMCQASPYDCPHNCAVYEFNVGCFKCDCNESSAFQGVMAEGDICHLPKVVGPCGGREPRFFYNTESKKCELFYFGGCNGNGNRFLILKECEDTCFAKSRTPQKCSPDEECDGPGGATENFSEIRVILSLLLIVFVLGDLLN
ncbi:WAP, Kazal, immunoglobulin, Kunitz and NTR domain-containing protein 1-like [Limulus polyphemus]|uniref:WAP, Kazal, immunoglobulin, Kunitz and NTR domain-containing protein 1-like n=1 Tax=Limulus polyphemus TaxID=6850 RepID=A0ABM1RYG8_LIMPO|nr:WAP, Kazal, immunoglobulin, Kunitz and NTR domain-containing protein 1-like [Limulus polyphemus]